ALRELAGRAGALALAYLIVVTVLLLLSITVIGLPFALVYLVRRSLAPTVIAVEGLGATEGLRRSRELIAGNGLRSFAIAAVATLLVGLTGPLVGTLLMLLLSPPLWSVNVFSTLVYVLLLPVAGIVLSLLRYDRIATLEGAAPIEASSR
ncbi:MAG TPA: hypothetical protein VF855_09885, partial [Acidimicrobiales bacterium]